jgi:hypothetical protein
VMLRITGWIKGFRAVPLISALRPFIGSLLETKLSVERLLDGGEIEVDVPDEKFEELRATVESLGAVCSKN